MSASKNNNIQKQHTEAEAIIEHARIDLGLAQDSIYWWRRSKNGGLHWLKETIKKLKSTAKDLEHAVDVLEQQPLEKFVEVHED